MLIYLIIKKKNVFHRTDGRTDTRSTQNYSSEPHKTQNFKESLTERRGVKK